MTAMSGQLKKLLSKDEERQDRKVELLPEMNAGRDGPPLGVVQINREEFPGTVGMPEGSERQYYDPRYNVWAVKFLCSYWGRNAYSTSKHGEITVSDGKGGQFIVYCHIDIATPRDNFLRHGDVYGPHIVIEAFQRPDSSRQYKLEANCLFLTPEEVYLLALHQHRCMREGGPRTWPPCIESKLRDACTVGVETSEAKQQRKAISTTPVEDEMEGGFGLFGE